MTLNALIDIILMSLVARGGADVSMLRTRHKHNTTFINTTQHIPAHKAQRHGDHLLHDGACITPGPDVTLDLNMVTEMCVCHGPDVIQQHLLSDITTAQGRRKCEQS